jgi:hypothetical protein
MSERGYFSQKWAIPGYAFILIVVMVNLIPLLELLKRTGTIGFSGALLAFLSLLTGSALGFLVTQVYWWWVNRNCVLLGLGPFKKAIELPSQLFGKEYIPPEDSKLRRKVANAILDFATYIGDEKGNGKLLEYIWRRWDVYTLLSSTYYTIIIGLVVGLVCRVYFEASLFSSSFNANSGCQEIAGLALMFVGVGVLLAMIRSSRQRILENLYPMWEAIIRHNLGNKENTLKKAFSQYFKDK